MAAQNRYDGVSCTALREYTDRGGRFGEDETTRASREALRELLPYVALGWAPEWISGTTLHCGPRALARSLRTMMQFHMPTCRFPDTCSFQRLVYMFSSKDFRDWRLDRQNEDSRYASGDLDHNTVWTSDGTNYYNQDLMYLLGYINYRQFLPIKFRLGLIREGPYIYDGRQVTNCEITEPIDNGGENYDIAPHPVVWIRFYSHRGGQQGHYESIGPEPGDDGLHFFHLWGLEAAARTMVKRGIFYVSEDGLERARSQRHPRDETMLYLRKYTWVYKHVGCQTETHVGDKELVEYPFGITPRSDLEDAGWVEDGDPRLYDGAETNGYIYIGKAATQEAGNFQFGHRPLRKRVGSDGELLPIRQLEIYPETIPREGRGERGGPARYSQMRDSMTDALIGDPYVPARFGTLMFGGINEIYTQPRTGIPLKIGGSSSSVPAKSSPMPVPKSTPNTSPPEPVLPPKRDGPSKRAEPPKRAKSPERHRPPPKKRGPSDEGGPGAATADSPLKKPKTNGNDSYPVASPQSFVGIKPSIYCAYSARPIRIFRAKEDSDVRSTGTFYDDLAFKANDILVAIQPIPDKPFYPFWARTQDLREGIVAPGVLEEFTEELYGERYLPWGLQNDNVFTPVPLTFNTYLQLGERHCRSLGKECGVDPDTQWPNDFIKQIIEHRLRRGIPMAFWKVLEPAVLGGGSPPSIAERYVRMKNWNSRHFLPDTADGRAFVWHMNPRAKFHYLPRYNEVVYAHDKNWGLQLSRTGRRGDLNSEDTTLIKEIDKVCPSSFYPRPVVHKPLTLLQKKARKGRQFLFGEPMSGDKTRFSFNTTMDCDLYNYKKNNGFDNTDPTPRPVIAVQAQHARNVPGHGKCLQFAVGDIIWMEAPVGPKPWQGWKASLYNDPRMKPWSGFVYPNKVRDLNEEERRKYDLEKAINNHTEKWAQKRLAEEEARVARKKAAAYGGANPMPMHTQGNTATEGTSTEPAPGSKTAPLNPGATVEGAPLRPASGEWLGAGKQKKASNAKPCFMAFVDAERSKLEKDVLVQKGTPGDPENDANVKLDIFETWNKEFQKTIGMGLEEELEATGLFDFATKSKLRPESCPPKWLAEDIKRWESSPAAKKTPFRMPTPPTPSPAPRNPVVLPTTNYVKPLYQRSPVAVRRNMDPVKEDRRNVSIYFKGQPKDKETPPKMGPLKTTEEQKEEEREKQDLRRREEEVKRKMAEAERKEKETKREKEEARAMLEQAQRLLAEANKSKKSAKKSKKPAEKKTSKKRKN